MTGFLGQVMQFAGSFAPQQWYSCEGQILPISQYTALFSLLGTNYGGNGTSTFALPDLRGRTIVGQGQGPGLSPYSVGQQGGAEHVSLITQNMPMHTHTITVQANSDGSSSPDPTNRYAAVAAGNVYNTTSTANMAMQPMALLPMGNNSPVGVLSPYLTVYHVICFNGLFPSRN
jgi:microcystin-dependent protein